MALRFNKAKFGFNVIHKFLIAVSIVTSLSLSVITIGNGIRTMEQTINNQSKDADKLIALSNSYDKSIEERKNAGKDGISNKKEAVDLIKDEIETAWARIQEYQQKRDEIDSSTLSDEKKNTLKKQLRTEVNRKTPGVNENNIDFMTKTTLSEIMYGRAQTSVSKLNDLNGATDVYSEAVDYDKEKIIEEIKAIAEKEYKTPNGTLISFFDENGNTVNVQTAIARLQASISQWQTDTGDVGSSSKIFTLLATYMRIPETAGGMAVSEKMMMVLIFIFGIIQEIIIAKLTPRPVITRKLLSQFSEYIDWSDFNIDKFLLKVYDTYRKTNILSHDEFQRKAEKCVKYMNGDINSIIKEVKAGIKEKDLEKKYTQLSLELEQFKKENENLKSLNENLSSEIEEKKVFEEKYNQAVAELEQLKEATKKKSKKSTSKKKVGLTKDVLKVEDIQPIEETVEEPKIEEKKPREKKRILVRPVEEELEEMISSLDKR